MKENEICIEMAPTFRMFSNMNLWCGFARNQKAYSENQEVSSKQAESFLQRALVFVRIMFLKNGGVSLMDLPDLCL